MNIYLIGYRGTGKTSLGKALAEELDRKFVDTDDLVVEAEGMPIPRLFIEKGEPYFRDCETKVIRRLAKQDKMVVATGGGLPVRAENREWLKQSGTCIHLTASPEVIYHRIYNDDNRPALTGLSPLDEIMELLNFRSPLYREVADIEVNTGEWDFERCLDYLVDMVGTLEGSDRNG